MQVVYAFNLFLKIEVVQKDGQFLSIHTSTSIRIVQLDYFF